jgi:heme A synthase
MVTALMEKSHFMNYSFCHIRVKTEIHRTISLMLILLATIFIRKQKNIARINGKLLAILAVYCFDVTRGSRPKTKERESFSS